MPIWLNKSCICCVWCTDKLSMIAIDRELDPLYGGIKDRLTKSKNTSSFTEEVNNSAAITPSVHSAAIAFTLRPRP